MITTNLDKNQNSVAVIAEWTTENGAKHTSILAIVENSGKAEAVMTDRRTSAYARPYVETYRSVPVPPPLTDYLMKPQPAVVVGDEGGFIYYGGAQLLPDVEVPIAKKPLSPIAQKALALGAIPRSAYWYTKTGGIAALTSGERLVLDADYKVWGVKNPTVAQKHSLQDYCLYRQRMHADLSIKLLAKRLPTPP